MLGRVLGRQPGRNELDQPVKVGLKAFSLSPGLTVTEGDPVQLRARIAADPKDFEARFGLAALLAHDGDFDAAFEQLLEVVLRDKGEQREAARKQLVEWFAMCPDAEAVSRGRRYLGMYLN